MRGRLAYLLGYRYLQFQKPEVARVFFQNAMSDADTTSAADLQQLSQAELDKLTARSNP